MHSLRILETSLYASDLEAARRFYHEVLELKIIAEEEGRHVFFHCGPSVLLLFNPATTQKPGVDQLPLHGAIGPGHAAFAVAEEELPHWRKQLVKHGIPIEHELRWPNGAQSIYFCDPAGNILEFATPSLWPISS